MISRAPSKRSLEKFAARSFYFDTFAAAAGIIPAWLHPGRSARAVADGLTVAWFGQLNPAEAQQRKLRQTVYVGEIYLDRLYRLPLRQPIAPELSRFQPVERDFSFVFADAVRWQSIAEALDNLHIAELTRFAPREIFRATSSLARRTLFHAYPHHLSGTGAHPPRGRAAKLFTGCDRCARVARRTAARVSILFAARGTFRMCNLSERRGTL